MAIAHDSEILGAANTTAGNYDTSITPTNTPNGVCVIIVGNSAGDLVTSVTYGTGAGAVLLGRLRLDTESTEAGAVYIYWAGGGNVFPGGAQTVRVARTSTTSLRAAISTMTVAAGQQVAVDTSATGTSASAANPSWTMNTTSATNTVCYEGIHSGLTTMTNTPASGWTLAPTPGFEDYGAQGRGWARRTFTGGGVTCGWASATADDFVGSSIAFKEVPPPTIMPDPIHVPVAGRPVNPGREAPTLLNP